MPKMQDILAKYSTKIKNSERQICDKLATRVSATSCKLPKLGVWWELEGIILSEGVEGDGKECWRAKEREGKTVGGQNHFSIDTYFSTL